MAGRMSGEPRNQPELRTTSVIHNIGYNSI